MVYHNENTDVNLAQLLTDQSLSQFPYFICSHVEGGVRSWGEGVCTFKVLTT